jgi:hypothetical protein
MRVNIQFSVNADAIPDRIISFMKEAEAMLASLQNDNFFLDAKEHIDNKNVLKAIERLALVRNELAEIDFRLDDCMTILGGYQKLLMGEAATEENE